MPLRLSCTSQHQKVQVSYVKFTDMQLLSSLAPTQNVAPQGPQALSQPLRLDSVSVLSELSKTKKASVFVSRAFIIKVSQ